MSMKPMTLQVPEKLYQLHEDRARRSQKSVEAEAVELLAAVVPAEDELPYDLAEAIAPLPLLSDEDLWRVARNRLAAELAQETEKLQHKRGREGLTGQEEERLARLIRQYEKVMLTRAEAAGLLRKRGHDVSVLLTER